MGKYSGDSGKLCIDETEISEAAYVQCQEIVRIFKEEDIPDNQKVKLERRYLECKDQVLTSFWAAAFCTRIEDDPDIRARITKPQDQELYSISMNKEYHVTVDKTDNWQRRYRELEGRWYQGMEEQQRAANTERSNTPPPRADEVVIKKVAPKVQMTQEEQDNELIESVNKGTGAFANLRKAMGKFIK